MKVLRDRGSSEADRITAAGTEGFEDDFAEPPISEKLFQQIQETFRGIYSDGA